MQTGHVDVSRSNTHTMFEMLQDFIFKLKVKIRYN